MQKEKKLRTLIRGYEKVVVAFSGGLDSSLLALIARQELGDMAMAVTVDSFMFPKRELKNAEKSANKMGIRNYVIRLDGHNNKEVLKNGPERCYHCKKAFYPEIMKFAARKGFKTVLDGTNFSELKEHRPGYKAVLELGVRVPLIELQFTRKEIRALAKKLGLENHDKPPMACLSSRIPHGEPITVRKTKMIENAENYLFGLGFKQVRVRTTGGKNARIEVDRGEIKKLFSLDIDEIARKMNNFGYRSIYLDPEGYKPGKGM